MFGIDPSTVLARRAPTTGAGLSDLGRQAALGLLGTCEVGRIAFRVGEGIRIVPVNFVIRSVKEHGVEVLEFRTTTSSELAVHAPGTQVAFEVDHIDTSTRSGWSVVVQGECQRDLDRFGETTRLGDRAADPWADGRRPMVLRLPAQRVTGKLVGLGEWDLLHG